MACSLEMSNVEYTCLEECKYFLLPCVVTGDIFRFSNGSSIRINEVNHQISLSEVWGARLSDWVLVTSNCLSVLMVTRAQLIG